jgi:uncharacterized protein
VSVLRPITSADRDAVLRWNAAHVELLSPLDDARLDALLGWCDLGCVITDQGRDLGFVLTFAAGSAYDAENFGWFARQYDAFYYLDRIVVDPKERRTGIATRVYDEIEERARGLAPMMCLEVNAEPPNEPSLEFHRRRGYVEVGQDGATGHLVSLLVKQL